MNARTPLDPALVAAADPPSPVDETTVEPFEVISRWIEERTYEVLCYIDMLEDVNSNGEVEATNETTLPLRP